MIKSVKIFLNACFNSESCAQIDFADPEIVKLSLAVILWHVILSDGRITEKEIQNLFRFFQNEFKLSEQEVIALVAEMRNNTDDIERHIHNVEEQLNHSIHAKAILMNHVNSLIICDGTVASECAIFEKLRVRLI